MSLRKRPAITEKGVADSQANGRRSRGPTTPEGHKIPTFGKSGGSPTCSQRLNAKAAMRNPRNTPREARMLMKTQQLNKELWDIRWFQQKIKSLKIGKLQKLIVGYYKREKKYIKMQVLSRMFLKTNEIQN
ncbi:MAG: hypothetical protein ABSA59_24725 [Terriglobia bacterium]|jgi:hypothetical protein